MKKIFEIQADVCKPLANAKRLEIIYALKDGERSVAELVKTLGLPKPNVSQHLAVLRACGVVKTRRKGVKIYYSIANPKIVKACTLLREVMIEEFEARRKLFSKLKKH